MTEPRRRSPLPPWWVLLPVVPLLALFLWLRLGDGTGDEGMNNVFGTMVALVAGAILLAWFTFARAYRWRTRLLALAGVLVVAVAFFAAFRITGVTGSMVPMLEPRWRPAAPGLAAPTVAAARRVDLVTVTDHDFPGYLGPRRDLDLPDIVLDPDWAAHPPTLLWRQPIGAGWSGFAVVNGVAVTQEERDGRQYVTAYDAETGALLWTHDWPGAFDHSAGGPGPRSTPAIDGGLVYAAGPNGRLVCLDGADGSEVWSVDLLEMQGATLAQDRAVVAYGRAGSPLVHGDLLIVPVGGTGSAEPANLVAFDKRTGTVVWRGSPNQVSYGSPSVAVLGGVEQVLIVNEDAVTGHDVATGRRLWSYEWFGTSNADASASQVRAIGPSSVLVSKGYGVGGHRLDLAPADDGTFSVTLRWHQRRSLRTKFTNVLVRDGCAYGLSDGILECVELEGGTRRWKSGRFGHGQILGVGPYLVVLAETGEVILVEASPADGRERGRFQGIEGKTWNTIALAGDLLLIRNGDEAAAYRLPLRTAG